MMGLILTARTRDTMPMSSRTSLSGARRCPPRTLSRTPHMRIRHTSSSRPRAAPRHQAATQHTSTLRRLFRACLLCRARGGGTPVRRLRRRRTSTCSGFHPRTTRSSLPRTSQAPSHRAAANDSSLPLSGARSVGDGAKTTRARLPLWERTHTDRLQAKDRGSQSREASRRTLGPVGCLPDCDATTTPTIPMTMPTTSTTRTGARMRWRLNELAGRRSRSGFSRCDGPRLAARRPWARGRERVRPGSDLPGAFFVVSLRRLQGYRSVRVEGRPSYGLGLIGFSRMYRCLLLVDVAGSVLLRVCSCLCRWSAQSRMHRCL